MGGRWFCLLIGYGFGIIPRWDAILIGIVVFSCSSCESLRVPAVASAGGRLSDMSCEIICFWAAGNEKNSVEESLGIVFYGTNFFGVCAQFVADLTQFSPGRLAAGGYFKKHVRKNA